MGRALMTVSMITVANDNTWIKLNRPITEEDVRDYQSLPVPSDDDTDANPCQASNHITILPGGDIIGGDAPIPMDYYDHVGLSAYKRLSYSLKYRPGYISPQLREALGMSTNELPPYIENMWVHGYPPGYMVTGQQKNKSQSKEMSLADSEVSEDTVLYPGFNAPPPVGITVTDPTNPYSPWFDTKADQPKELKPWVARARMYLFLNKTMPLNLPNRPPPRNITPISTNQATVSTPIHRGTKRPQSSPLCKLSSSPPYKSPRVATNTELKSLKFTCNSSISTNCNNHTEIAVDPPIRNLANDSFPSPSDCSPTTALTQSEVISTSLVIDHNLIQSGIIPSPEILKPPVVKDPIGSDSPQSISAVSQPIIEHQDHSLALPLVEYGSPPDSPAIGRLASPIISSKILPMADKIASDLITDGMLASTNVDLPSPTIQSLSLSQISTTHVTTFSPSHDMIFGQSENKDDNEKAAENTPIPTVPLNITTNSISQSPCAPPSPNQFLINASSSPPITVSHGNRALAVSPTGTSKPIGMTSPIITHPPTEGEIRPRAISQADPTLITGMSESVPQTTMTSISTDEHNNIDLEVEKEHVPSPSLNESEQIANKNEGKKGEDKEVGTREGGEAPLNNLSNHISNLVVHDEGEGAREGEVINASDQAHPSNPPVYADAAAYYAAAAKMAAEANDEAGYRFAVQQYQVAMATGGGEDGQSPTTQTYYGTYSTASSYPSSSYDSPSQYPTRQYPSNDPAYYGSYESHSTTQLSNREYGASVSTNERDVGLNSQTEDTATSDKREREGEGEVEDNTFIHPSRLKSLYSNQGLYGTYANHSNHTFNDNVSSIPCNPESGIQQGVGVGSVERDMTSLEWEDYKQWYKVTYGGETLTEQALEQAREREEWEREQRLAEEQLARDRVSAAQRQASYCMERANENAHLGWPWNWQSVQPVMYYNAYTSPYQYQVSQAYQLRQAYGGGGKVKEEEVVESYEVLAGKAAEYAKRKREKEEEERKKKELLLEEERMKMVERAERESKQLVAKETANEVIDREGDKNDSVQDMEMDMSEGEETIGQNKYDKRDKELLVNHTPSLDNNIQKQRDQHIGSTLPVASKENKVTNCDQPIKRHSLIPSWRKKRKSSGRLRSDHHDSD